MTAFGWWWRILSDAHLSTFVASVKNLASLSLFNKLIWCEQGILQLHFQFKKVSLQTLSICETAANKLPYRYFIGSNLSSISKGRQRKK